MVEARIVRQRGDAASVVRRDCTTGMTDQEREIVGSEDVQREDGRVSGVFVYVGVVRYVPVLLAGYQRRRQAHGRVRGEEVVRDILDENTLVLLRPGVSNLTITGVELSGGMEYDEIILAGSRDCIV